jgi:hypothetical protein
VSEIRITNSAGKIELLKEWMSRKGNEPWTGEEIAELIADAHWLVEEFFVKLLEDNLSHDYDVPARDNSGDLYHVAEFCTACRAVALVKGENE